MPFVVGQRKVRCVRVCVLLLSEMCCQGTFNLQFIHSKERCGRLTRCGIEQPAAWEFYQTSIFHYHRAANKPSRASSSLSSTLAPVDVHQWGGMVPGGAVGGKGGCGLHLCERHGDQIMGLAFAENQKRVSPPKLTNSHLPISNLHFDISAEASIMVLR
ncbi:hypothetical protein B0H63DRAFT_488112 [Podospora didyma]|uniref:Secreted protein n=1 Tax=Podospora didyma TaxID=330526 RepID=A0AAE0K1D3_9PEZI|nr:hypothetical protein B0H63DRAFT_488112 [Podospora didyma]